MSRHAFNILVAAMSGARAQYWAWERQLYHGVGSLASVPVVAGRSALADPGIPPTQGGSGLGGLGVAIR